MKDSRYILCSLKSIDKAHSFKMFIKNNCGQLEMFTYPLDMRSIFSANFSLSCEWTLSSILMGWRTRQMASSVYILSFVFVIWTTMFSGIKIIVLKPPVHVLVRHVLKISYLIFWLRYCFNQHFTVNSLTRYKTRSVTKNSEQNIWQLIFVYVKGRYNWSSNTGSCLVIP